MKKIIQTLSVLCVIAFNQSFIQAQENFKCASHIKMQEVYAKYPYLELEHQQLIANAKQVKINDRGERETVYVIPVVFHVIHEHGSENISDDQIYNQMEILNIDFRRNNSDTVEIMNEFKALATDSQIEFKLASIDPFGNCTNGIEHIYSHETNIGDDPSKLNQWPRSRYLNVWVVKNMENGVAGYAYYPSAVSGGMYYADGIIIRHNYIGSIGTSSTFNSRALTHEIGHYLGLPHTWGNTNEPGVTCGDDGIDDTPITKGHTACVLTNTDDCINGIAENVQNFMEYSYCSRMYTPIQANVMRSTLENPVASRNNLITTLNHSITGIDVTTPLCEPLADFTVDKRIICVGSSVQFKNATWRAAADNYVWTFDGGTPSTSNSANPLVTYNSPGKYSVTLTSSNASGSNTKTMQGFIYVAGDWWEHSGNYVETFSSGNFGNHFFIINPEDDNSEFEVTNVAGYNDTYSATVHYFKPNLDPILDLNYFERLGGSKEILITPTFNLSNLSGASLSFKFAHAVITSGLYEPDQLSLKTYFSINCGETWTLMQNLQGFDVLSAGYVGGNFIPDNSQWYSSSINLPSTAYSTNVRFKFEFTADDYANNFYLDDIQISGTVLTEENDFEFNNLVVYPSPTDANSQVKINYTCKENTTVRLAIVNALGDIIYQTDVLANQGQNMVEIKLNELGISSGIYYVNVQTSKTSKSARLVIQ